MVGASHSPGGVAARSDRTATIKFLCSYGGKILPRYPDGKLRYLGGVTRVLAVDRSIPFSGSKRPSHWIKQNLKTQGATAAILPLDVHVKKICHCQNQRSTRSVCSVFCTESSIHNHSGNYNNLTDVPESAIDLCNLRLLDPSDNQIRALPDRFGRLKKLIKLIMDQNPHLIPPMEIVDKGAQAVKDFMDNRRGDLDAEKTEGHA